MAEPRKAASIRRARCAALLNHITGKTEASSTTLAASYGLGVDEVRSILRGNGVKDNG